MSSSDRRAGMRGQCSRSHANTRSSARTITGSTSQSVLSRSKAMARTSLSTGRGYHSHVAAHSRHRQQELLLLVVAAVDADEAPRRSPSRRLLIPLDTPDARARTSRSSARAAGCRCCAQGELCVWDSLAICEYVAELTGRGWPQRREARAVARSVCAEMHSGFTDAAHRVADERRAPATAAPR